MLTGLKLLLKPHTLPSPDPPLYLPPASGGDTEGGGQGGGLPTDAVKSRFDRAQRIVDELLDKIRGLSFDLRPPTPSANSA
jgi:hypothetical protein